MLYRFDNMRNNRSPRAIESLESRRLLAAAVVGSVFRDLNGNGVRESTEGGQANAKVYLDYNANGTRDGDAEPIATTTSAGTYRFENVAVGAPVQLRLLLTGTNLVQTFPTGSAPRVVTPVDGQTKEAERFGVNEPTVTPPTPPPATTGVVEGVVFRDANGNGARESTEAGQANVKVYLDYNANGQRDGDAEPIAVTGSTGSYRFATVTPTTNLNVRLLLTGTNFVQTRPTDNAARIVTVVAGQAVGAEAFGVKEITVTPPTPPPATTGVVEGVVFRDANGNGARDASEGGQANVKVYLDYNNNGTRDGDAEPIAVTSSTGGYRFATVTPTTNLNIRLLLTGTNFVQTRPTNNSSRVVTVVAGASVGAEAFGVKEITPTPPVPPTVTTAVVSGSVFTDRNNNGKRDSGEAGRPKVRVYLDLDNDGTRDDGEPATVTGLDGSYKFEKAPVRGALKIRLDLSGTRLAQTLPAANAPLTLKTEAGKKYGDQIFGVHEIATANA